jgi:hypothetical protein
MDNPVPFETKEQFIRHMLRGLTFTVRSMKNAYQDVPQWYSDVLTHVPPPSSVEFIRFAGDKGENASKFSSLERGLEKLGANITAGTVAIPPVESNGAEEMSATIVRQHAYRCYLSDKEEGFRGFEERFGHFYGEFTGQIYKDILYPVLEKLPKSGTKKVKSKK